VKKEIEDELEVSFSDAEKLLEQVDAVTSCRVQAIENAIRDKGCEMDEASEVTRGIVDISDGDVRDVGVTVIRDKYTRLHDVTEDVIRQCRQRQVGIVVTPTSTGWRRKKTGPLSHCKYSEIP